MARLTRTSQILLIAAALVGAAALGLHLICARMTTLQEELLADPPGAAVTALVAHPTDADVRLVGTTAGLFLTTDRGRTWHAAELPSSWCSPATRLLYDVDQPDSAYALGTFGLGVSRDGGRTWAVAAPPPGEEGYLDLLQSPVDGTLYIVAGNGLLRSGDHGDHWAPLPLGRDAMRLTSLAVHPGQANVLYAVTGDGLLLSTDRGNTWNAVSGGPTEVAWVGLDTAADGYLLAYTSSGIYQSSDGGTSFGGASVGATKAGETDGMLAAADRGALAAWLALAPEPARLPWVIGEDALLAVAPSGSKAGLGLAAGTDAMYQTTDGGLTWEAWGTMPSAAPIGLLVMNATGNGAFGNCTQGLLSRIAIEPVAAGALAPWLAAAGGLLAALAIMATWRERRRDGRHNRSPLSPEGAQAADAPLEAPGMAEPVAPSMRPPATGSPAELAGSGSELSGGSPTPILPGSMAAVDSTVRAVQEPTQAAPSASAQPTASQDAALESARRLCDRLGLATLSQQSRGDLVGYMIDASRMRLSLPSAIPLVIALVPLAEARLDDEIRTLAAQMGAVSSFTLVLDLQTTDAASTERPRPGQGLIVLDAHDVDMILQAGNPAGVLLELIQRDVPLAQISPFVQSGPVNRTMFFGREYEITALQRALHDKSFAIVGGRKIGKTSFLGRVHQRLEDSDEFAPLYVDCHHVADDTGFLRTLSLVGGVPVESASVDVLRRVVMRLRGRPGNAGRTIVLELDEVDNLLRYDLANDVHLFRTFRALSDEGLCRFVLCGERVLDTVLRDPQLPLQGFCGSLRLGYLTQEESLRLVREPLAELGISLQDPERLAAGTVALSGRHPNILQAVCQLLIERVAGRQERIILLADLEAVAQSSAFHDLFFEMCWGNATTTERLISVLMSQKQQFSKDQVRLALEALGIRLKTGELEAALEGLVLTSLITPAGTGYSYTSDAFSRVLGETGFAQGFRDDLAETLLTEQNTD